MSRPMMGADPPRRIVIFRALQLGDLLCVVPALRALRAAFPRAETVLVGLGWARAFVDRFAAYLDGFLEFPGYPGLPERTPDHERIPVFLAEARRRGFDLALQMHGSGEVTNPLVARLGARAVAGFHPRDRPCPSDGRFLPYPEEEPEVRRHLRLIEFLGVPLAGEHLEFPLYEQDRRELRALPEAELLRAGDYVCIHPGARYPSRRWAAERFAAVGDALAAQGLRIVLTGSAGETALTEAVARAMRSSALDLAGRTTLGALGVLVADARLLVSNDSGVSHLAAALRAPSVVVVTGSDDRRWAPLDRARHRVVRHPVECSPCPHATCPIDHRCATRVLSEEVLRESESLLRGEAARAA